MDVVLAGAVLGRRRGFLAGGPVSATVLAGGRGLAFMMLFRARSRP